MSREERINRASHASRLLEDDLLLAAFAGIRERYIQTWATSSPHDTDGRERAYRKLSVLGDVQDELESWVTDGDIAGKK